MKFLLIASLALFSASSFAKNWKDMDKKMNKMSFEDAKKYKMEMLEKKTANLEDDRKCVNDAKDKEALKKCMKESMENEREMKHGMKEELKADMKDMKDSMNKATE